MGGDEATDETRKPLDEKAARTIAVEILEGLAALHEHGIVHRDIKPQNILRCDDVWKIADFGISKLMNNPVTGYTFQGTSRPRGRRPNKSPGAGPPFGRRLCLGQGRGIHADRQDKHEKTLSVEPPWREILVTCVDFHAENRPAVAALVAEVERLGQGAGSGEQNLGAGS